MLLLLALLGCNPAEDIQAPIDGPGVAPSALDGGQRIETRMARAEPPARPAPPPVRPPPGQAVYTDCGAGPWPARAGSETVAEEPGYYAPLPRPAPKPSYRPSRPTTPTPDATATIPMKTSPPSTAPASGSAGLGSTSGEGAGGGLIGGDVSSGPKAGADGGRGRGMNGEATPVQGQPVTVVTESAAPAGTVEGKSRYARADDASAAAERRTLEQHGYVDGNKPSAEPAKKDLAKNKREEKAPRDNRDPYGDADRPEEELDIADEEMAEAQNTWWDWGATVHLSNDDSMSLASAQRVLFQVMNGRRPKLSEIRPHELLNYFSFDTVPVPDNQMFSVLGAAEAHDGTLSVALAVQGGTPVRQPLDLTLAIDRSGSMAAEGRVSYTRRGLDQMVNQLQTGDRIDLVWFESRVCTTLTDFVVGRDDPALLTHAINGLRPMGSTDLDGGMKEAYRIQRSRSAEDVHGRNRRVMLITDAFLNTGSVDPGLVSDIGTAFDSEGIRLTAIGVGRDFNDEVLDKLTEKGKGAYVYLGSEAVVDRVFGAGFDSLVRTLAHDVRFSIDLPPSLAMQRFYGEEASTDAADIQPINYYAGTSQVFLQDLKIKGPDLVLDDPITMRISWRDAATGEPDALVLNTTVAALMDSDSRNLHKAQALMAWGDWTQAWAMGGDACGMAMESYAEKTGRIDDDAELAFLSGLVQKTCGKPVVASPSVAYKVRVDSDIPIAEVGLACAGKSWSERIGGSDTIARFDKARPGSCTLTLQGNVAMVAAVEVPSSGGDVRCTIRGGRMSCG